MSINASNCWANESQHHLESLMAVQPSPIGLIIYLWFMSGPCGVGVCGTYHGPAMLGILGLWSMGYGVSWTI